MKPEAGSAWLLIGTLKITAGWRYGDANQAEQLSTFGYSIRSDCDRSL